MAESHNDSTNDDDDEYDSAHFDSLTDNDEENDDSKIRWESTADGSTTSTDSHESGIFPEENADSHDTTETNNNHNNPANDSTFVPVDISLKDIANSLNTDLPPLKQGDVAHWKRAAKLSGARNKFNVS